MKIVVVGAGVAGLTAARDLAIHGYEVILLEARDRIGGRIYSATASDGHTPVELGASYWEGFKSASFYQQYFSEEKDELKKAHTLRIDKKQSLFYSTSAFVPSKDKLLEYCQIAEQIVSSMPEGKAFQTYIDEEIAKLELPDEQASWLRKLTIASLQQFSTPLTQVGYGAGDRVISTHTAWNDEDAKYCLVTDGFDKVINQLKEECLQYNVCIVLNNPVSKITQHAQGVAVNAGEQTYEADAIVCALPLGVLKAQKDSLFSPPLSNKKNQAINKMGIHDGVRIVLEFEGEPFWENPDNSFYIAIDKQEDVKYFRNGYMLNGKTILSTDSYTTLVREKKTESAIIECITNDLQHIAPHVIPKLKSIKIHDWTNDPYAKGAYPYETPQITTEVYEELNQPENGVYFAGADIHSAGFSAHNAYDSGEKCARKIHWDLERKIENEALRKKLLNNFQKVREGESSINFQNTGGGERGGLTYLIQAIYLKDDKLIDECLNLHPDLDLRTNTGMTALMKAASDGNKTLVEKLLKAGADPTVEDKSGVSYLGLANKTAIDYALMHNHEEIADLFKHHTDKKTKYRK
ncbi:MAG TPA: FAD-dependent oxidoreductase [Candidatus Berkiella sp.]|nr:FAD-dependent oxidoreductase [Candidatus Berkiella sp.]